MNNSVYETKSGKPIRLWQGDCMGLMEDRAENHWDLAIVDPPYGIKEARKDSTTRGVKGGLNNSALHYVKDYGTSDWDDNPPTQEYFDALYNCTSNQIVWGGNHFGMRASSCWLVWDKDNGRNDFADCELAWCSFDSAVRKFKHKWHGMLQEDMSNKQERIHRNEKPIRLYRWLLQNYAKEGDTILDTHGGSMSLAIACYIEDFELDIIELDKDYYNSAVKRFEQHISQKTLF